MRAKGMMVGKQVENDLAWFLTMEEGEERVERSVEFIAGVAGGRLAELCRILGIKEGIG